MVVEEIFGALIIISIFVLALWCLTISLVEGYGMGHTVPPKKKSEGGEKENGES